MLIGDYSLEEVEVSFLNLAKSGPTIDLQQYLPIKRGDKEKGILIGGGVQIICKNETQKAAMIDFLYGKAIPTSEGLVIFANGFDVLKEFGSEITQASINKMELVQSIIEKFQKGDIAGNRDVTVKDMSSYWEGIDEAFMNRIGYAQKLYVDGSYDMNTARSETGFLIRLKGGEEAGRKIVQMLSEQKGIKLTSKAIPIDIVAHSMGFAYSLGVIKSLQNAGYKIGWVYSIAPENPSVGYVPPNIEGIWQYGSDENDGEAWYMHDQIAPQSSIGDLPLSKRVFIPNDGVTPRGVLSSHSIGNYKWIFNKSNRQNGYVKQRN